MPFVCLTTAGIRFGSIDIYSLISNIYAVNLVLLDISGGWFSVGQLLHCKVHNLYAYLNVLEYEIDTVNYYQV